MDNIFKVLKEKKTCQLSILYPAKISFKNEDENKIKTYKIWKNSYQQTCTIRNFKGSPSGRMQIIPDGNSESTQGTEDTVNGNYMGKICDLFS